MGIETLNLGSNRLALMHTRHKKLNEMVESVYETIGNC